MLEGHLAEYRAVRAALDPSQEYLSLDPELRATIDNYLSEYPVRLGAMAKKLGVRVLLSTLPRGTSGQITIENDVFVIRVNRHEASHRQRATLAHEMAHFLLHRDLIEQTNGWYENVLLRSGKPKEIEVAASRLSYDLILPSDLLFEAAKEYTGPMTSEIIDDLARRFKTSTGAIEYKLQLEI